MKVILKERIKNYGSIGDIVKVKPGYGRNYLIPKNKAMLATEDIIQQFAAQKDYLREKAEHLAIIAQDNYSILNNKTIELKVRSHSTGHLYGSVTVKDILNIIKNEFSIVLQKQQVKIGHPIRNLGQFTISLILTENLIATVNLCIVKQDS